MDMQDSARLYYGEDVEAAHTVGIGDIMSSEAPARYR